MIVAITMPGIAKMTRMPWSASHPPHQPRKPQTRTIESPTTTGERARGRSMSVLSRVRPGTRRRTMSSAASTPKIVFRGTTINVIWVVSQSAWTADGLEMASQKAWRPPSKARQKTMATGPASTRPR